MANTHIALLLYCAQTDAEGPTKHLKKKDPSCVRPSSQLMDFFRGYPVGWLKAWKLEGITCKWVAQQQFVYVLTWENHILINFL